MDVLALEAPGPDALGAVASDHCFLLAPPTYGSYSWTARLSGPDGRVQESAQQSLGATTICFEALGSPGEWSLEVALQVLGGTVESVPNLGLRYAVTESL